MREVLIGLALAACALSTTAALSGSREPSTMQKELQDAADAGTSLVGMTVAKTTLGGNELVGITRRVRAQ